MMDSENVYSFESPLENGTRLTEDLQFIINTTLINTLKLLQYRNNLIITISQALQKILQFRLH